MSTAAHSTAQAKPPRTTAAWDTRTIVVMGLLASIGVLLSFVEIGNFFGFMKYDASNVPAIVGGFLLGRCPAWSSAL